VTIDPSKIEGLNIRLVEKRGGASDYGA